MTEQEAAWLAGYIDGDGCITFTGRLKPKPIIVIDSCDEELLTEVKRIVGLGCLVKKKKYKEHHRQAWTYRLTGTTPVIDVLNNILPYMRCAAKKGRASVIVSEWKNTVSSSGIRTTTATKNRKQEVISKVLSIGNGRGSSLIKRPLVNADCS